MLKIGRFGCFWTVKCGKKESGLDSLGTGWKPPKTGRKPLGPTSELFASSSTAMLNPLRGGFWAGKLFLAAKDEEGLPQKSTKERKSGWAERCGDADDCGVIWARGSGLPLGGASKLLLCFVYMALPFSFFCGEVQHAKRGELSRSSIGRIH